MRKPSKKAIAAAAANATTELVINMGAEVVMGTSESSDPALDALMAELNDVGLPMGDDEVLLPNEPTEFETTIEAAADTDDDLLASAVSGAEMLEAYDTDAKPLVEAGADAIEPKAAADKKEKKAKAAKAPKEPKPAKEPKTFYGLDKLKRLTDRGVNAVMLKGEESLTGDDLAAAQEATIAVVAAANQKVKNRTTNILEFVTGKTNVLNNLIRVCFNLIEKEGVLVTGEKGNMWATMSTCYGAGTIRSGGNNSVAALRDLKIIVAGEKGYIKNPDSALYERIAARLCSVEAVEIEEPVDPVVETAPAEEVVETASEVADAVA